MAHTTQKEKIVSYLQHEYLKTGANDPVAWKLLAAKLDLTEEEIRAAMHESFTLGQQLELKQVGYDNIQLGPRALLEAERQKKS
jgi:hypothetical protein